MDWCDVTLLQVCRLHSCLYWTILCFTTTHTVIIKVVIWQFCRFVLLRCVTSTGLKKTRVCDSWTRYTSPFTRYSRLKVFTESALCQRSYNQIITQREIKTHHFSSTKKTKTLTSEYPIPMVAVRCGDVLTRRQGGGGGKGKVRYVPSTRSNHSPLVAAHAQ